MMMQLAVIAAHGVVDLVGERIERACQPRAFRVAVLKNGGRRRRHRLGCQCGGGWGCRFTPGMLGLAFHGYRQRVGAGLSDARHTGRVKVGQAVTDESRLHPFEATCPAVHVASLVKDAVVAPVAATKLQALLGQRGDKGFAAVGAVPYLCIASPCSSGAGTCACHAGSDIARRRPISRSRTVRPLAAFDWHAFGARAGRSASRRRQGTRTFGASVWAATHIVHSPPGRQDGPMVTAC